MMEGSFLSIQNDSDETEWKFYAKFYITSGVRTNFWTRNDGEGQKFH